MTTELLELPMPNQVFQRAKSGTACIPIRAERPVRARIVQGRKAITPWQTTREGIRRVPVGGPYTLEVDVGASKLQRVAGLLVGDLWVLAGQSNMDGCGKLVNLEPPSPLVHCYYYTEQWGIAKDPICRLVDSIDPVHWPSGVDDLDAARENDRKYREIGASLGVRFGKRIVKATGVPVGLIVCSHGGTSIEQWDPGRRDEGGRSLYGSMVRRVRACGGRVAGMLWYQGESNANPQTSSAYKERMRAFIEAVRRDFSTPALPFLQVQLARFFGDANSLPPDHWNRIQQVQLDLTMEMKQVGLVAAIDSALDDIIHINTPSLKRLGDRLAELALVMVYGAKGPGSLAPAHVDFVDTCRTRLRIRYKNVRGRLSPAQDVRGFFVEDPQGNRIALSSARARGNAVLIELERAAEPGSRLWYGRGLNPATNLRDATFAAPVFGPVRL